MFEIRCRTNLDLHKAEQWPSRLPAIPNVGDVIESGCSHRYNGKDFRLTLQVCRVTWKVKERGEVRPGYEASLYFTEWVPEIELHMTNFQQGLRSKQEGVAVGSPQAFYEWYAPLVGSSVGAFI